MALKKVKLGDLLELCDERNSDLKYDLSDVILIFPINYIGDLQKRSNSFQYSHRGSDFLSGIFFQFGNGGANFFLRIAIVFAAFANFVDVLSIIFGREKMRKNRVSHDFSIE